MQSLALITPHHNKTVAPHNPGAQGNRGTEGQTEIVRRELEEELPS